MTTKWKFGGFLAALAIAAMRLHAQTQTLPQAPPPTTSQAPNPTPTVGANATISATPDAVHQSGEDPAAVARGANAYASAGCGSCHGATAKGTDAAPDLVRSPLVEDDKKGELIGPVLSQAHPKGGQKPSLSDQQISDIAAWLRVQVYGAAMRDTYSYLDILVGNPQKGKAFFNGAGKCNTCHSVTGDLRGIGSKYDPPELQALWISGGANARFGRGRGRILTANGGMLADASPPEVDRSTITITVTLPDGQKFTGVPVSVDDFHVAFRDMTGAYHSFDRHNGYPKVAVHNPLEPHWNLLKQLTDDEMHNVTAYLVSLP